MGSKRRRRQEGRYFTAVAYNNTSYKYKVNHTSSAPEVTASNNSKQYVPQGNHLCFYNPSASSVDASYLLSSINLDNLKYITNTWFSSQTLLTSIDLSKVYTGFVTNMTRMFQSCEKLTSITLTNVNTTNVTLTDQMFEYCESLTSINASSFTGGKVTRTFSMFFSCTKVTSIDLSNFNTPNLTDVLFMFYNCTSLTILKLNKFDISKNPLCFRMFTGCPSTLNIYCTEAFRTWAITNAVNIGLPTPLRTASSSLWHIV